MPNRGGAPSDVFFHAQMFICIPISLPNHAAQHGQTPSCMAVLDRRSISREAEGASGTSREPLLGHTMSAAQQVSSQHTGSMAAGSLGALLPRRMSRRSSSREDTTGQSSRGRSLRPMAGADLGGADTVLQIEEAGAPSIADSQVRAAPRHSLRLTSHPVFMQVR